MNIGERIKARRQELKMSADKLGEKIGKDRSTIFRYEKGEIETLPLDILTPLAEALKTTPAYLMGWISEDVAQKNDSIANIVLRLRRDNELLPVVEALMQMSAEQYQVVQALGEDKELYSMVEKLAGLDADKRQAVNSVLNAFVASGK